MSDSSVVEKELNNTVNVAESEHCFFVSLEGRRVNDASKVVTFNMQTTLDFIGHADTLCIFELVYDGSVVGYIYCRMRVV